MKGYRTKQMCEKAAEKFGVAGLTGRGQACGIMKLDDGSYVYHTANNVFGGEPTAHFLFPTRHGDRLFSHRQAFPDGV